MKLYVAVKTCLKFHTERIPVIQNTWAKFAKNIGYFTDQPGMIFFYFCLLNSFRCTLIKLFKYFIDSNLPNGIIVPNTEQGHCAKTYAILQHVSPILKEKKLDWLAIVDDDTIIR